MSIQTFYSDRFAFIDASSPGSNDHSAQTFSLNSMNRYALIGFDLVAATRKFNIVTKLDVTLDSLYAYASADASHWLRCFSFTSAFNEQTVTYSKRPQWYAYKQFRFKDLFDGAQPSGWLTFEDIASDDVSAQLILRYGLALQSTRLAMYSPTSENKPKLIVTTSDVLATGELKNFSPASGSIDLGADNTFTFAFVQKEDEPSIEPLAVTSFKLQWRVHGSSTVRTINVTSWEGDTPNYTVSAGTFSGSSIDWCVVATTNAGQTLASDWMTLSTVDATPTAIASSPNGNTIDRSIANTFRWTHVISSGTLPTKSELQRSTDGETWTALATVNGSGTSYMVPANTFAAGSNFWRVRTYNTSNEASEWSDSAQFYAIGAPAAPVVLVKSSSPRPEIAWQATDQQAYEVEIMGAYAPGPQYGTSKAWKSPVYLSDGSYTARVRVQNQFGYWSSWGTAALPVSNTIGATIALAVDADDSAQLSWQSTGSYDFYLVYRDGKLIARTTVESYIDTASIGSVTYQVRGCYTASSNYTLSSEVTVDVAVQYVTVSDMDTGVNLALPYSESAHRTTARTLSRSVQAVQLAGRAYPVIERSEHMAESISVACVFYTKEDCAALEALTGHIVTVRTPEGRMVTGCLSQLSERTDGEFYSVYTFTVDQADWEEAIDIDA